LARRAAVLDETASGRSPGSSRLGPRLRWTVVWTRAVVGPAWRRAAATWLGCAIVAAVVFGPRAMQPADLTGLVLHNTGAAVVLGLMWVLLFVPTARLIVRPPADYLYSLPGAPRAAQLVGAIALLGLQLPWVALWILGEGARGAAIVLATTVVVGAMARWRPPRRRSRLPAWPSAGAALRLPIAMVSNVAQALRTMKDTGFWIFGLDSAGEESVFTAKWAKRTALVIGNETAGMRGPTRKECDVLAKIPLAAGLDSLNAAVAAGIALFEAARAVKAGPFQPK